MNKVSLLTIEDFISSYDYGSFDSLSLLLSLAYEMFPAIDSEISKNLNYSLGDVTLWRHGDFVPTEKIQEVVVDFIHAKISSYTEDSSEQGDYISDLVVYRPKSIDAIKTHHAEAFYQKLSIFGSVFISARNIIISIISLFKTRNIGADNLKAMVAQASSNRRNKLSFKITREIAKCNRVILSSIRSGQYSVVYPIGDRTPLNIDIARGIKQYLNSAGFTHCEILFNNYLDDNIYIEIGLEDVR